MRIFRCDGCEKDSPLGETPGSVYPRPIPVTIGNDGFEVCPDCEEALKNFIRTGMIKCRPLATEQPQTQPQG